MEHQPTPEQSLKLINEMIAQAKKSFHRMSFYFLLWGILLIVAMMTESILDLPGYTKNGISWVAVGVIGGIASWWYGAREGRQVRATSTMDRVMMWLWLAFIVTLIVTIVGYGVSGGGTPTGSILVLTGLPTFVSGQLVRFRPLIFGGILFWVLGGASYFVDVEALPWLYISAMIFGYVIPGYLLKREEDGVRTP